MLMSRKNLIFAFFYIMELEYIRDEQKRKKGITRKRPIRDNVPLSDYVK